MKCIKCGSRRDAPVLYEMPAFSEETEKSYTGNQIPDGKQWERNIALTKGRCRN